ncbi:MAG: PrsW family intramembrane metalloprotease [Haloarculaceae archaeon]
MDERDPVQRRDDGSLDLYDITRWEPRSTLDRIAVALYRGGLFVARLVVVLTALLILVALVALGSLGAILTDPAIGALALLSAIPAFLLAGYVYVADVTESEPLGLLVATFLLGVLFAGFAGVVNSYFGPNLRALGLVGFVVFFYLVVAPVEETVKWLAVRLYAFRSESFNAVVDGAVYGAMAGLGFATIENALYISQQVQGAPQATVGLFGLVGLGNIIGVGGQITAFRALAGPGHVIYAAFSGYYLGLAKFNPDRAGPIVVKGLLVAALIHATYNTLVSVVPAVVLAFVPGLGQLTVFLAFVLVYDGLFGYVLVRKLARYRRAYRQVHAAEERDEGDFAVAETEFDP